jgi:hypothetical protein
MAIASRTGITEVVPGSITVVPRRSRLDRQHRLRQLPPPAVRASRFISRTQDDAPRIWWRLRRPRNEAAPHVRRRLLYLPRGANASHRWSSPTPNWIVAKMAAGGNSSPSPTAAQPRAASLVISSSALPETGGLCHRGCFRNQSSENGLPREELTKERSQRSRSLWKTAPPRFRLLQRPRKL